VSFSAILDVPDRRGVWEPVYAALRDGIAAGAPVFPQVSCRPMRFDFDLETGCASLDAMPCWRRWRAAESSAARLALLADADFRAAVRAESVGRTSAPASRRWAEVVLEDATLPAHEAFVGRTLAEIAAVRGGDVVDALLDVSAAEELHARFSMLLVNYDDEHVGALLRRPESLIALSDAGRTSRSSATRATRPISSATGCASAGSSAGRRRCAGSRRCRRASTASPSVGASRPGCPPTSRASTRRASARDRRRRCATSRAARPAT
jgi:hypothetical protein